MSGAMYNPKQATEYPFHPALYYYKERIKQSRQNNGSEPDVADLFNDLSVAESRTRFVISTIAAVPEYEFENDSSDEEDDRGFREEIDEYKNKGISPFTTNSLKKTTVNHKICEAHPRVSNADKLKKEFSTILGSFNSKVVDNLLKKVLMNGFEGCQNGKDEKLSLIAFSIGMNCLRSLSTRKNYSLLLELESEVTTNIITKYKKFGFFWECQWYSRYGCEVDIETVRRFYKKLKSKDKKLAKKFISQEEKIISGINTNIPFQDIREYAKNHSKTRYFVQYFGEKNCNALIYLHLVDADVIDFNGIYSEYLRIVRNCNCSEIPTIMSTGFVYPEDSENKAYHLLSAMERMHRVVTTFCIPLGTYYPEPNMCILIPPNWPTVPESFIDPNRGKGKTLESAILLTNIQNNPERSNVHAIFSEDNPIITATPSRVKVGLIGVSPEFNQGPASPTRNDIKKYEKVSQSHTNRLMWSKSLFINKSIKYNDYQSDWEDLKDRKGNILKGVDKQCNQLIAKIRHNMCLKLSVIKQLDAGAAVAVNIGDNNVMVLEDHNNHFKTELYKRIGVNNTDNIVVAIEAIEKYNTYFYDKYGKTTEEKQLIDIINKRNKYLCKTAKSIGDNNDINIWHALKTVQRHKGRFYDKPNIDEDPQFIDYIKKLGTHPFLYRLSHECLLMIVSSPIMDLIKDDEIDVDILIDLDEEMREYIIKDDSIIQALHNKEVHLIDFIVASEKYHTQNILESYLENPELHLKFIAGDPRDFVYKNSNNYEIVEFAVKHQYVNDDDISCIKNRFLHQQKEFVSILKRIQK